jgi:uncharacterized membrane protein YeaQ/YmgE (transglycosylase-associated protein family)
MTPTLISLLSILMGIIGANTTGKVFRKFSTGLIGNTIAGVFGSILLIKSFGRLGFDPMAIISSGTVNYKLFLLNSMVSFLGGALLLIAIYILKTKLSKTEEQT